MDLKDRLREHMIRKDLRVAQVGKATGLNSATISKFINGKTTLLPRNVYKIQRFLGIVHD